MRVPSGASPEAYFAGLFASALFGVTAGTLLFLTGVLFIRTSGVVSNPRAYTVAGQLFYHPEHETAFFLAGGALSVVVVLAHTLLWNWRLQRPPPDVAVPDVAVLDVAAPAARKAPVWMGLAGAVVLALAALVGGMEAFFVGRAHVLKATRLPSSVLIALLLVVGFCIVAGAVGIPQRFAWSPGWFVGGKSAEGREALRRPRLTVLDVLVPVFLIAVLLVPAYQLASGQVFAYEQFFHWDFFSMGSTMAFSHGQALGAQVHSEYGMGWPMLFSFLAPLISVSYGQMILVSSVVACVYYMGAYLLLRVVTGRAAWAAAGTLLAVLLQMFTGNYVNPANHVHGPAWELPSILMMRRPLDVWVFLALVLYHRRGRMFWAVAGGVLTGAAVVFSTDTGLYLAVAYLLFWAAVVAMRGRRSVRPFAASLVTAGGVFLLGLAVASRGTLWSTAFWRAWWEPISQGAHGYTALPIVGPFALWRYGLPDSTSLIAFVLIVMLYLALVSHLVIKVVHRRAVLTDVILGCVSAYGLLTLISFLGRSDPVELPHLYVPLALVVTVLAGELHGRVSRLFRAPEGAASSARRPARVAMALVPFVALSVVVAVLWGTQDFRDYPGPLQTIGSWSRPNGVCLMDHPKDVCGLPVSATALVQIFRQVTSDMKRLSATGQVGVLDFQEQFNVAAGIAPWGPYVPVLDNLFTTAQAHGAVARFVKERPRYVFIRFIKQDPPYVADVARQFRTVLRQSYTLTHTVGPFEVWQANPT